jgi:hypothetical protein
LGVPYTGNVRAWIGAVAIASVALVPSKSSAQDHGASHGHHKNHAGLFLGATRLEGHSSFTVGADYERRLPVAHERFGAGALIDAAVGDEPEHVILAATISVRPVEPLKLVAGPGVQFSHGHRDALFRVGAAVDLPLIQSLTISPGVFFDFAGGHRAMVIGVTIGRGF